MNKREKEQAKRVRKTTEHFLLQHEVVYVAEWSALPIKIEEVSSYCVMT